MATVRAIQKSMRIAKAIKKHIGRRNELKKNKDYNGLHKLPVNSSPSRLNRRCELCGRPKAVYRKFGLCRICLREAVMRGDVPGCVKSSW